MKAKLHAVRVQRFKCIQDAPFDLADVNVLVGANNSGKSSIIQALHFSIGALQTARLEDRFPAAPAKGAPISTSLSPDQLIYSPSKSVNALGIGGALVEPAKDAIRTVFTMTSGEECAVTVRRGRNRNILIGADNAALAYELASLEEPYSVFSPGLAGIAKEEQYVSDGVLLRTIARGDANLVLRNTLLRLWDTSKWDDFLVDLLELFPGVDLDVRFNNSTDQYISTFIVQGATQLPLELAGTGLLQATQILSYIHQFAPSIVVLDEPDSHLHPNNQRLLCTLLQNVASERNTQVILTTHSRHVVDAIGSTSRFLWVRNGTVDTASADDEIGVLLDIGALDVKERASIPGTRALVLTEDKILQPLRAILQSSGFDLERTVLLPYYGCTNPSQLRPLLKLIRTTNPDASIAVHRDRDYLLESEADDWAEQIRALKAEPFLTSGVDIESHFLSSEHLAFVNARDAAEISQMINETRSALTDALVEKYVNGRCDVLRKSGKAAKINAGKLATEAPTQVRLHTQRFSHGKLLLAELRRRFREQYKTQLRVFESSSHVASETLALVAKKAFPQGDACA